MNLHHVVEALDTRRSIAPPPAAPASRPAEGER